MQNKPQLDWHTEVEFEAYARRGYYTIHFPVIGDNGNNVYVLFYEPYGDDGVPNRYPEHAERLGSFATEAEAKACAAKHRDSDHDRS